MLNIHKYLIKCLLQRCLFFSSNALNAIPLNAVPLKCVSLNNQDCKKRLEIININRNEPLLYPYSIQANKCNDSCNNSMQMQNLYAKLCVSKYSVSCQELKKQNNKWHKTLNVNAD